ncbi:hypothetical protein BZG36_01521 [Bifiguratus adelaidae]|uniref:CCAAT-binding factor domain-containing protein n=1 Tax=Bifiguratus adelaidae TaxID=1938954 RepID=A0A261Y589_9FUNG|nr:hypothetical protein BZG36_01521 [Bifiguratus adelaidae]
MGKAKTGKAKGKASPAEDALLQEVLKLGGSQEDMSLLQGIDDDEGYLVTEGGEAESKLTQELSKFIENLGLNKPSFTQQVEVDDTSVEPEEEEEEEEESLEDMKAIIEPAPQWHAIALEPLAQTAKPSSFTTAKAQAIHQRATELLSQENTSAEKNPLLSTSDRSFLTTMLKSGTLSDRISALTLLVQESPIHGVRTLDTLLGMCRKKSRKEAMLAMQSLKDLLVGSVLPDRKLKYFIDQPLWDANMTDKHLVLWCFEDHLKKWYFEFVQILESLSHDSLTHVRHAMLTNIFDLLVAKPEQEQNLLKLLVNKLGDSENKVSAKVSHLVQQLLIKHPNMKLFVVKEVESLLLRSHVSERAQYYAIVTINQTILTQKDTDTANKLIDVYFTLFRQLLAQQESAVKADDDKEGEKRKDKKRWRDRKPGDKGTPKKDEEAEEDKEGMDSKLIAAVLTGVNRAFPFAKVDDTLYESHLDILFRITHNGTFNTSIQALLLIFHVCAAKESISDRFYRTLYESLLDARLLTSSKQSLYLNLLFRALRADIDMKRVKAFIKRLVQIASYHQPPFICGTFYMIGEVMDAQPGLKSLVLQPEEEDEEEHFVDVDDGTDEVKAPQEVKSAHAERYDGRKRDPRFSHADRSCLWEITSFVDHFHPTVSLYAKTLLEGNKIQSQPDLHSHTLTQFLDRFVFRNAKKSNDAQSKGGSIMQPMLGDKESLVMRKGAGIATSGPSMNDERFWRSKVEDVPVDQLFFHKYFTKKGEMEGKKKRKDKAERVESEDKDEDKDEEEIWKAMVGSMPGDVMDDDDQELDDSEDDEDLQALLMGSDSEEEENEDNEEEGDGKEPDLDEDEDEEDEEIDMQGLEGEDMADWELPGEKRKHKGVEGSKKKRQRRSELPTFASYEDYAHLLEGKE